MSDLAKLVDFEEMANSLEIERKNIIEAGEFDDPDDFVRVVDDAQIILNFIKNIQIELQSLFTEQPSLTSVFSKDYCSYQDFISKENILDLIFLDDCLFPDKEKMFFGQDGGISLQILGMHEKIFSKWCESTRENHKKSQLTIKENFTLELKHKELACQCVSCIADYRTKLREHIFDLAVDIIDRGKEEIADSIENGIQDVSNIYYTLKKDVEKSFYQVRFRLKRSSLNRLESQVKSHMEKEFNYPSELAIKHIENIKLFLYEYLDTQELSRDLITELEYTKFFNQLSSNLWRNERYIEREFKKFVKAIVLLKRKDVSSTILQAYLGEFWVHSLARTIKRKIIYHMGPTNSGKTYHAIEALSKSGKGCYLAPLRLLAGELYDTLNEKGVTTNLLTGEEVIEQDGATHYSSTIEMARLQEEFDCVVIDEIQMIKDPQRGWAWTRALVNVFSPEIHVCGDNSVFDLVKQVADLCGDELIVENYNRMTKLEVQKKAIVVGDLQKNDALIVFSRRNALRYKMDLERIGYKVSVVYGRLSPEVRREQARKFDHGETDIMVSTDAIAMGMNLPVKRIVFSTLSKFFNSQEHPISDSEIKQIAGRAGRYKRFPTGYATTLTRVDDGPERVEEALTAVLDQEKKCMVGPDLDIFNQVNTALEENGLNGLSLSEFLRLFNTMTFQTPFFCVELKEMIDVAEMVEEADPDGLLSDSEIFGFACAPVNLGLMEHVQYFNAILGNYVVSKPILSEKIDANSTDIDYLETSIKCVELYQWLSRHFNNKNFDYDLEEILENKADAVDKLNQMLSQKIVPKCSSCGTQLEDKAKFAICESCFEQRKQQRRGGRSRSSGKKPFKGGKPGEKGPNSGNRRFKSTKKKRKFSGKPNASANKSSKK